MMLKRLDRYTKKKKKTTQNLDAYLIPYTKINLKCVIRPKCDSWNHEISRKEHKKKIFATLEQATIS